MELKLNTENSSISIPFSLLENQKITKWFPTAFSLSVRIARVLTICALIKIPCVCVTCFKCKKHLRVKPWEFRSTMTTNVNQQYKNREIKAKIAKKIHPIKMPGFRLDACGKQELKCSAKQKIEGR